MDNKKALPELLSPAQDMNALISAISSGADAVYFGTNLFNARIKAKNFDLDASSEAIKLCHAHGVKAFVTLNISILDKEIPTLLEYVTRLYNDGVDALIVADLGIISLLREKFPDLEIHASTQASAHNLDGVDFLSKMGVRRTVIARELDKESITHICKNADADIEIFVHGAHCMSVSGQCLMSYAMGGRSGNRGECAQPCRLPYAIECGPGTPPEARGCMNVASKQIQAPHITQNQFSPAGASLYLLSLKDMSLSGSITEIIDTGARSLKIEGRMKSSDYVGGVTKIWRGLLDKRQNATQKEKNDLSSIFSRQGFTDGYFRNKIDDSMLGIRSEENKEQTKGQNIDTFPLEKPKIDIYARFFVDEGAQLTLVQKIKGETRQVTVRADIVERAQNVPMSKEDIIKNLSKLGSTPFALGEITVEKDDNIMVRVSAINALRREAANKLLIGERNAQNIAYAPKKRTHSAKKLKTALFTCPEQIPENAHYFDRIYVPCDKYKNGCLANGVYLPPVVLDREWQEIEKMLIDAKNDGVKYALVSNIGQIKRVKALGFEISADFRFNVFNGESARVLDSEGFENVILSPELTLPQARDITPCSVIVYGKIPVMTTHKCVLKTSVGCDKCSGYLIDRTGAKMFVSGIYGHRNIIYNSVPIYMADKMDTLSAFSHHFIFSDESASECEKIINAYKNGTPTSDKIRRIKQ